MNSDPIVRVCYAAVREYLRESGHSRQPLWPALDSERQGWWRSHVERALSGMTPPAIHEAWYADRDAEGFTEESEAMPGDRTHPAFVHWDRLSGMYQTVYFLIQMNSAGLTLGASRAFEGSAVTAL